MKALILTVLIFVASDPSSAQHAKKIIRPFLTTDSIESVLDGCACRLSAHKTNRRYIFISTIDGTKAWMNIAGQVSELTLARTAESDSIQQGIVRIYKGGTVIVRITIKRIQLTKSPRPETDGYPIRATVNVKMGSRTETAKISGWCGC